MVKKVLMIIWNFLCEYIKVIYKIMFCVGIALIVFSWMTGNFSWKLVFSSLPTVGVITASYLWIRLDVWRTEKTINDIARSNVIAANDLRSRKADSCVALGLLILVAIVQPFFQFKKLEWLVFFGTLFILLPSSHWTARWMVGSHK
ncbi:MAG: hypothetical protein PHC71_03720 [Candidatus Omnitrophica bacterium]|nr:hypothetical protein [Candidatus Omnitrophota bacterium]